MSESLPGTAPLEGAAAASVEDPAPAPETAVATESAPGEDNEKVVPAARFNGLMGKFNQTKNALDEANRRIAELEAASVPAREETSNVSDTSALEQQVAALQQMLMQEQVDKARKAAIEEYPEAAPFADLIIADTPEAVKDMARVLAERVKQAGGSTPPAEESAPAATEQPTEPIQGLGAEQPPAAPPAAPVVPGGTTAGGTAGPTPDEAVQDALSRKDFSGFLQAAWARKSQEAELVL